MKEINILILSAGTRNKVVGYFKKELAGIGKVITTDCNALAPAIYLADKHYITPRIDDVNYLDVLVDICKKEQVSALFSLIDPELTLLANHRHRFSEIGVIPIVSDAASIEICFNKYSMSCFLESHGFHSIKTYDTLASFLVAYEQGAVHFPVFVKPVCGSCSSSIQKVHDMDTLRSVMMQDDQLMIQEFMAGKEYGVDVYVDLLTHETVSIFAKEKVLMRAGETDKSVSVKIPALFETIQDFTVALPFFGHIDIDVFEKDGNFYVSEVNPRFGGGYPHAYECGVNFPALIINNLREIANTPAIGAYEEDIYMMKYLDVFMKRGSEL